MRQITKHWCDSGTISRQPGVRSTWDEEVCDKNWTAWRIVGSSSLSTWHVRNSGHFQLKFSAFVRVSLFCLAFQVHLRQAVETAYYCRERYRFYSKISVNYQFPHHLHNNAWIKLILQILMHVDGKLTITNKQQPSVGHEQYSIIVYIIYVWKLFKIYEKCRRRRKTTIRLALQNS